MNNRKQNNRPIIIPRTRTQIERSRPKKKQKLSFKTIAKKIYFGRFPLWLLCVSGLMLIGVVAILFTIAIPWYIVLMVLGITSILVLAAYYIYMQRDE